MKLKKIEEYLPDTADSVKHASAKEMEQIFEGIAKEANTTVSMFEVNKGTAVVGFADDKALAKVDAEFSGLENVKISEISLVQFQLERNRERQGKIDAARATREQNKKK